LQYEKALLRFKRVNIVLSQPSFGCLDNEAGGMYPLTFQKSLEKNFMSLNLKSDLERPRKIEAKNRESPIVFLVVFW
jgi:hypothetical protein